MCTIELIGGVHSQDSLLSRARLHIRKRDLGLGLVRHSTRCCESMSGSLRSQSCNRNRSSYMTRRIGKLCKNSKNYDMNK